MVMTFGGLLSLLGVPIPGVEIGIAASLLMLGWLVRHPQECPRSHPAPQWCSRFQRVTPWRQRGKSGGVQVRPEPNPALSRSCDGGSGPLSQNARRAQPSISGADRISR